MRCSSLAPVTSTSRPTASNYVTFRATPRLLCKTAGCLTAGSSSTPLPWSLLHAKQRPQHTLPCGAQQPRGSVAASASSAFASAAPPPGSSPFMALVHQYSRFVGLVGKFMPMVGLFFLLAFNNTILDSLKDTLVITAVGGGAQVIPYLTVYAVLPSSIVFLVLYSYASQIWSRSRLFNGIILVFVSFFAGFAFFLYPNQATLHPHQLADRLAKVVPSGLDGLVGMIRNWTFTMFFCMSELWGDVCLGLLFWGLANDTTTLEDAPTLYPLFGLGANIAQALAGLVLKSCSGGSGGDGFAEEIKFLMLIVLFISFCAMALHSYINYKAKKVAALRLARRLRRTERAAFNAALLAKANAEALCAKTGDPEACALLPVLPTSKISLPHAYNSIASDDDEILTGSPTDEGYMAAAATRMMNSSTTNESTSDVAPPFSLSETTTEDEETKPRASILAIFKVLAASVPIRCLATMSLAQGLCSSLMEFAWKSHIRLMYPSPGEFTAFLGDVSTCQGVVTGLLMFLSPAMFERLGWKGVAGTSPYVLMWGGSVFFSICIVYQYLASAGGAAMLASLAPALGSVLPVLLEMLVFGGAALYVFSKSAKFSLFKPAEEMVYISMDEEGRTKGKAAIDVVGSQAGKSGGSILQQLLLLASGGAIGGSMPIMFAVFMAMAKEWINSVSTLAAHADYGHQSTVHPSANNDKDSDDEDAGSEPATAKA